MNLFRRFRKQKSIPSPTKQAASNDYLVDLRQVIKLYETPAGPFPALRNVDLTVSPGEFVAVIGKSGSGKSTLINMITGIDRPTMGEIYVAGTALHTLSQSEMARWRGQNLGVVFQFFQLLPTLTLLENIMLPMEFCRRYRPKERVEQAMQLLEMVDMADQAYKFPSALSGGQQQRVAIARSLANDPAILVADEPTGNLDSRTADSIFRIFNDFVAEGKTILMVTHDRDLASRVNRVVLIADGEIVDQQIWEALPMLDKQELVELSSRLESVRYEAGQTIFEQGDQADKFYIIVKGSVEVVMKHESSNTEMVVAHLGRGQYFGEAGLVHQGQRNATVRVSPEKPAIVMAIGWELFQKLVEKSNLTHEAIARLIQQHTTTNHLRRVITEQFTTTNAFPYKTEIFEPGAIIIQQGDQAEYFYMISQGKVDVMSPDDEEKVIIQRTAGQYFGEMGLLREDAKRANTVRAALDSPTPVTLISIDKETFHTLLVDKNLLKEEIALTMQQRLDENLAK